MPKLIVQNLFGKAVFVAPAQKVLSALQANNIDWMHACGAKGRCTTCRIIVLEGNTQLSKLSVAEQKYREQGRLQENERLTCQLTLHGDAVGLVPAQTKFPHMLYSD